ncbi:MAG: hypothetical protein JWN86_4143 [Planctomycetota bacterium]|nr:hypothetical protein [Planctomycetota bacterium]
MPRSRAIRFGALWAVLGLVGGVGCTHNHYYYPAGTAPGSVGACDPLPPGTVVSSTGPFVTAPSIGAVCDVPPQSQSGSLVAQGGARTTPIVSNAGGPITPRPIYSQPVGRPIRRGGTGLVWRNSQTESLATTKIEGADEETSLK